jgi:hypothetical protein
VNSLLAKFSANRSAVKLNSDLIKSLAAWRIMAGVNPGPTSGKLTARGYTPVDKSRNLLINSAISKYHLIRELMINLSYHLTRW